MAAIGVTALAIGAMVFSSRTMEAQCGAGFRAVGAQCNPDGCPPPLAMEGICRAPDVHVLIADTVATIGPSDWEAEGRIAPRAINVPAFRIDAFEMTVDGLHARGGLSREEAAELCEARGGRLPTEDEWIAAAATAQNRRYPWGDTGAVCRRGAWGLVAGPCAKGATSAGTVGAHIDGDTPSAIHDLAGNVAEWVIDPRTPDAGIVRGGSYASTLATELRTWARVVIDPNVHEAWIGARCVFAR